MGHGGNVGVRALAGKGARTGLHEGIPGGLVLAALLDHLLVCGMESVASEWFQSTPAFRDAEFESKQQGSGGKRERTNLLDVAHVGAAVALNFAEGEHPRRVGEERQAEPNMVGTCGPPAGSTDGET